MPLCYNTLLPSPGIYGHHWGHLFIWWRCSGWRHFYFRVQNTPLACIFQVGIQTLSTDLFHVLSWFVHHVLQGGNHFNCDLYTMCNRKKWALPLIDLPQAQCKRTVPQCLNIPACNRDSRISFISLASPPPYLSKELKVLTVLDHL